MKDRFVLPTFRSEYSDLLQDEDVATHMAKLKQRMQVQCMRDEQMEQSED